MIKLFVVTVETTVEVCADSPSKARKVVRERGGDGNPTRVGVRRPVPYATNHVWVEAVVAECEACDAYLAGEDDDSGWETDPEDGGALLPGVRGGDHLVAAAPACVARLNAEGPREPV